MDIKDRYNREHLYGKVSFWLEDFYPDLTQCKFLMLKVIEQTVKDYCSLYNSNLPNEILLWETAADFIFDDEYVLQWGNIYLKTEEFLDILDIDIDWFREQVIKKFKAMGAGNGTKKNGASR